jgi:hypothetical protein
MGQLLEQSSELAHISSAFAVWCGDAPSEASISTRPAGRVLGEPKVDGIIFT